MGKTQEAVDAARHGKEVDLVPAPECGVAARIQAPLIGKTGAEAAEVLDVHGVHRAAVAVDAEKEGLAADELMQRM